MADPVKILLVEDESDLAKLIASYLKGFDVKVAHQLEKAGRLMQENQFDLIITDVRLKEESGLSLVRDLRGQKRTCPIILISGYDKDIMPITALMEGAFTFLEKPFQKNDVIDAVRVALRGRLDLKVS
ncbi:MAG: response regulator [Bdellovibrionales bacterium]|nr:response regulator [Bdellovibrionales bacterium]